MLLIPILIFVFGLLIGSFINCVVYRVGNDLSYIKGRSFCPECKHSLGWTDNIPVISFLFLRGKCYYCHSPISWRYPIGEILTGFVFSLIYLKFGSQWGLIELWNLIFLLFLSSVLLIVFLTDLQYQIIPVEFVIIASFIEVVFLVLVSPTLLVINIISAVLAALFFLFLYFITKKKGMGLGDVYFAFLMGLILGFPKIIFSLYLAFLTGAVVGVILILVGKKHRKQKIAFGPFLAVSAFIFLIWGNEVLKWITAHFF